LQVGGASDRSSLLDRDLYDPGPWGPMSTHVSQSSCNHARLTLAITPHEQLKSYLFNRIFPELYSSCYHTRPAVAITANQQLPSFLFAFYSFIDFLDSYISFATTPNALLQSHHSSSCNHFCFNITLYIVLWKLQSQLTWGWNHSIAAVAIIFV
jgi:hypothetical protein